MSSGAFERTFYELDNGDQAGIRVQPETLDLVLGGVTNQGADGPANNRGTVRVNGSRRRIGVNARLVYIKYVGAAPTGYVGVPIALPWFQKDSFDDLAPDENVTGTYLGFAVRLTGKRAETIR